MENLKGILLMVASMATFALTDTCVKLASKSLPVGEILALMGGGGAMIFGIWSLSQRQALFGQDFFSPLIIARNLSEMFATFSIVTAVILIPLSTVSAIVQAAPLVVTMGAALFLNEAVGWRRWSAISVGFFGVLIIVRPGLEGFQPATIFAVMAVIGQAARDLATRAMPAQISSLRIGFYGLTALFILGVGMMIFKDGAVIPRLQSMPLVLAMIATGTIGYHMLNLSIRMGDVSLIIPFRYSRILFAIAIGMLVFGERPDFWTLLGSGIVVGSGIYALARERRHRAAA